MTKSSVDLFAGSHGILPSSSEPILMVPGFVTEKCLTKPDRARVPPQRLTHSQDDTIGIDRYGSTLIGGFPAYA